MPAHDPELRREISSRAANIRTLNQNPDQRRAQTAAATSAAKDWHRDRRRSQLGQLGATHLADMIRRAVDALPPLTAAQRWRLGTLLRAEVVAQG